MKYAALLLLVLIAAPLEAQSAGETGAQVLQFNSGGRAAALSGAYATARDADVLFYNPAGVAGRGAGASAAYESYATDIGFGSLAAFTHFRGFSVGASIVYLDAGEITELTPDPEFGGTTGTPTGRTISASEAAVRVSGAFATVEGRARIGASVGLATIGIADYTAQAPIADVGAQYDAGRVTLAASARNLGGSIAGAPLPTELRLGAATPILHTASFGAIASADAVSRIRESAFDFVLGLEAGLLPAQDREFGAVARIGFDTESGQLGALHFGAGITLRAFSLDYAYQSFDFAGAAHRFGLRWGVR